MDVDRAHLELRREPIGEHLHVASEHDELRAGIVDQLDEFRLLFVFRRGGDRQAMERNAVRGGEASAIAVVRDDGHGVHAQCADLAAIEKVVQAVVEFADHDQNARRREGVVHRPCHAEAPGHGRKAGCHPRTHRGTRRGRVHGMDDDTHEEAPGVDVAELVTFQDVAAVVGQKRADRPDDAGTVDARQRQDVAWSDHWRQPAAPPAGRHQNRRLHGGVAPARGPAQRRGHRRGERPAHCCPCRHRDRRIVDPPVSHESTATTCGVWKPAPAARSGTSSACRP